MVGERSEFLKEIFESNNGKVYKKIFVCSNCENEFIEDVEIDDFDKKVENLSTDFICFKDRGEWNVYHKCAGGEIGMKVFKCFREVRE